MRHFRIAVLLAVLPVAACSSPPPKGENNGDSNNGASNNGASNNGASNNGASNNGASNNGASNNGMTNREIWARDYDQTCVHDGDCAVVHEGDACLCGGAACGNTGISAAELERWNADREAACPAGEQICSAAPCLELHPVCREGTCGSRTPIYVDASTWDTSCVTDDDCAIVHEGEVCSACVCGGTAVNVSEYPKYATAPRSTRRGATPAPAPPGPTRHASARMATVSSPTATTVPTTATPSTPTREPATRAVARLPQTVRAGSAAASTPWHPT